MKKVVKSRPSRRGVPGPKAQSAKRLGPAVEDVRRLRAVNLESLGRNLLQVWGLAQVCATMFSAVEAPGAAGRRRRYDTPGCKGGLRTGPILGGTAMFELAVGAAAARRSPV